MDVVSTYALYYYIILHHISLLYYITSHYNLFYIESNASRPFGSIRRRHTHRHQRRGLGAKGRVTITIVVIFILLSGSAGFKVGVRRVQSLGSLRRLKTCTRQMSFVRKSGRSGRPGEGSIKVGRSQNLHEPYRSWKHCPNPRAAKAPCRISCSGAATARSAPSSTAPRRMLSFPCMGSSI